MLAEFNKAVQKAMVGLDILPAEVIPPNPAALLDSKRMASLIETFSKNYDCVDCVIFDTPPQSRNSLHLALAVMLSALYS
jgi:Mrp family chromosome partitioning ATPase